MIPLLVMLESVIPMTETMLTVALSTTMLPKVGIILKIMRL